MMRFADWVKSFAPLSCSLSATRSGVLPALCWGFGELARGMDDALFTQVDPESSCRKDPRDLCNFQRNGSRLHLILWSKLSCRPRHFKRVALRNQIKELFRQIAAYAVRPPLLLRAQRNPAGLWGRAVRSTFFDSATPRSFWDKKKTCEDRAKSFVCAQILARIPGRGRALKAKAEATR